MLLNLRTITAIVSALLLLTVLQGSRYALAVSETVRAGDQSSPPAPKVLSRHSESFMKMAKGAKPVSQRSIDHLLKEVNISYESRRQLLEPLESPTTPAALAKFGDRVRQYVHLHSVLLKLDAAIDAQCGRCERPTYSHAALVNPGLCCSDPIADVFAATVFATLIQRVEHILFPWAHQSFTSVSALYLSFARAPSTRGIVLTTGMGFQARMAMVSIRSIRASGCTLPIEVMYSGDNDMDANTRARIEAMGNGYDVVTRDLTKLVDVVTAAPFKWAAKPF
ncbi:hypothetical protein HDU93_004104, partial [Gonapodya sp. JEL0774]